MKPTLHITTLRGVGGEEFGEEVSNRCRFEDVSHLSCRFGGFGMSLLLASALSLFPILPSCSCVVRLGGVSFETSDWGGGGGEVMESGVVSSFGNV